jgi:hypothetical protein
VATDIADWTQAVNVTAGTVTITGTANVAITNTPSVTISGTPSVSVSSGTVNIGNTPSVTISGTPTVILGGGVATIGSISSIGSTVTVAGTINIGNTPAVTISGTPNVNISSGTVAISGTPNINIQSQSVTVQVNLPWSSQGSFVTTGIGAGNFNTTAVPTGTQVLGILIDAAGIQDFTVTGNSTGIVYKKALNLGVFRQGWTTIPVNASADSTYKIAWAGAFAAGVNIRAYASGLIQGYPTLGSQDSTESIPVTLATDQLRTLHAGNSVAFASRAGAGATALIPAIAGQNIWVFGGQISVTTAVAAAVVLLQTTAGLNRAFARANTVHETYFNNSGAPVGTGAGLNVVVAGGAAAGDIAVAYTQDVG